MATMKQIADLAGVSRGTVDRVLNGRGVVSEETAKKIRKIADSLNYTPSIAARSLAAMKRNIKIAYVMPDIRVGPFFTYVKEAAEKKAVELQEYGFTVDIVTYSNMTSAGIREVLKNVLASGVSGIAVAVPKGQGITDMLREIAAQDVPIVTVNTDVDDSNRIAYVGCNAYQCGATGAGLVRILAKPNSKVAAIVTAAEDSGCVSERSVGFFENMQKHAPEICIKEILTSGDDAFEAYSTAKSYLTQNPDVDIVYVNGAGVYGVCRAIESLPAQKRPKLICYDLTEAMEPMLCDGIITATICQQPDVQGAKPLDILFNYLALGIKPEREYFYTNTEIILWENKY